jgi:hypothetical protein
MDEGRNMIMLFPTLVDGINTQRGREAFKVQSHIFYSQRVLDFVGDGAVKWSGLDRKSERMTDDGELVSEQ